MKRRRGRRGFWWWSWLLALITILGVVGGFLYGKKRWEDGPKDYVAAAKVSVHIRPPFVARGAKLGTTENRFDHLNEEAFLRELKSEEVLAQIVEDLKLYQNWEMAPGDAITELRTSVEFDHNRVAKELAIIVTQHDPELAAQIANTIAEGVYERVKIVDAKLKQEGAKKLELELAPHLAEELAARKIIADACAAKSVPFNPNTGISDSTYLLDPAIRDAHLEWDATRENLLSVKRSHIAFESHWKRDLRPSIVTEKAFPPPTFSGPEVEPIQMQWALYGLTLGLILGSVLSLICWKLFP
jgi:hypothetical protein